MSLINRSNTVWVATAMSLMLGSIVFNLVKSIFFNYSSQTSLEKTTIFVNKLAVKEDFIGRWQINWVQRRSETTIEATGNYSFQKDGKFTSKFIFYIKDKFKNGNAKLQVDQKGKWLVESQKLKLIPQPGKVLVGILQSNLSGLTLDAVKSASEKEEVSSIYHIDKNEIKLVRYRIDLLSDFIKYSLIKVD